MEIVNTSLEFITRALFAFPLLRGIAIEDLVHRDKLFLAPELHLVQEPEVELIRVFQVEQRMAGDHQGYAVSLRQLLQSGCKVHAVGDDGALHEPLVADDPEHHGAAVNTDSHSNRLVSESRAMLIVDGQMRKHGHRGGERGPRRLGEQRHDGVSDVLVNESAALPYEGIHPAEVGIEKGEALLRLIFSDSAVKERMSEKRMEYSSFDIVPQLHVHDARLAHPAQELLGQEPGVGVHRGLELFLARR